MASPAKKIFNRERNVFIGYCAVTFLVSVFLYRDFWKYAIGLYLLHTGVVRIYYRKTGLLK